MEDKSGSWLALMVAGIFVVVIVLYAIPEGVVQGWQEQTMEEK